MRFFSLLVGSALVVGCRSPPFARTGEVETDGGDPTSTYDTGSHTESTGTQTGTEPDTDPECWEDPAAEEIDWGDCTFEEVVAGISQTCARTQTGRVACWGDNELDLNVPGGVFTQLSPHSGGDGACALRADGCVRCWGESELLESLIDDVPRKKMVGLSDKVGTVCSWDEEGRANCWGTPYLEWIGQMDTPEARFKAMSVGWGTHCGILDDGSITCWGLEESEYLVTSGMMYPTGIVEDVPLDDDFVAIQHSDSAACALHATGEVTCWGFNGKRGPLTTPIADGVDPFVEGVEYPFTGALVGPFVSISGSNGYGLSLCGVTVEGDIECLFSENPNAPVTRLDGPYKAVSVGDRHTCALDLEGHMSCWIHDGYWASLPGGAELTPPCATPLGDTG